MLPACKEKNESLHFLDEIKKDAGEIFIVGDLFDFWYEYRTVVPKGYMRILGKLAELTDAGIPIHFFVGNHDMWMKGYFETGIEYSRFIMSRKYLNAMEKNS